MSKEYRLVVAIVVVLLATAYAANGYAQSILGDSTAYVPIVFKSGPSETPLPTVSATPSSVATTTVTALPSASATPTTLPTASATALPVDFPLVNGDFEQGITGWQRLAGARIVEAQPFAHSGSWLASLGGSDAADEALRQRVRVPTDRPYLVFWYTAVSEEQDCSVDTGFIWIDPNPNDTIPSRVMAGAVHDFCSAKAHLAWQQQTVDLTAYAGQLIRLDLTMTTNDSLASYWQLDDIAFSALP